MQRRGRGIPKDNKAKETAVTIYGGIYTARGRVTVTVAKSYHDPICKCTNTDDKGETKARRSVRTKPEFCVGREKYMSQPEQRQLTSWETMTKIRRNNNNECETSVGRIGASWHIGVVPRLVPASRPHPTVERFGNPVVVGRW